MTYAIDSEEDGADRASLDLRQTSVDVVNKTRQAWLVWPEQRPAPDADIPGRSTSPRTPTQGARDRSPTTSARAARALYKERTLAGR